MTDEGLVTKDFLVLCGVGFAIACAMVAYLLYWFFTKSKSERLSKIKFKNRKSKSLGKAVRRSKLGDEKVKTPKKGAKMDDETGVRMDRRTKEESSSSSSNKSLRQAEPQDDLQAVKVSSEQPLDYGTDVRTVILKQQVVQPPPDYDVERAQLPPQTQKMPQIRLPSEAAKSSKREKSIVLVEPNKFLKKAGIDPDQDQTKDRLKSFTSRVETGRSNLMAKKMDSVVAYQTSPISLEGGQEADQTSSTLNGNNPTPKFKPDDSNKNTASILSVANSKMPRDTSEPFIGGATKSTLSTANNQRPSSGITFASSKEFDLKSTSSSSSRKEDSQSRKYETRRKTK